MGQYGALLRGSEQSFGLIGLIGLTPDVILDENLVKFRDFPTAKSLANQE